MPTVYTRMLRYDRLRVPGGFPNATIDACPLRVVNNKCFQLVSSKYLTAFSDFRIPRHEPNFVTPETYVQYLHDYVEHYRLKPHIQCNSRVIKIEKVSSHGGHVVHVAEFEKTTEFKCDAIAVCSGLNVHPRIPMIPGIERVPTVLHSSQLKRRDQFGINANVVVLGAGETGMDIAHLAVTSPTTSVTICHRNGFFCAPKVHLPTVL